MGPSKMDDQAVKRIAKALGPNHPFAKRAEMASRNSREQTELPNRKSTRENEPDLKKDSQGGSK
ncbi:hypothetical protein F4780DRAFT_41493 [Xylariomycetidae sp. FL0641]|nr:hypothetical protein F4780DRAFT_41493 [Xylariomycetidae sp. FL0641]